jgi:hypothetical protein
MSKRGRPKHSKDEYKELLKRANELKEKGYKHSALWNRLEKEFNGKWKATTILQIYNKLGNYKK